MVKKDRLSLDEHKAIAAQLFAIRNQLLDISLRINNAYPFASKQATASNQAVHFVDDLRNHMDSALAKDFPDDFDGKIYYPGSSTDQVK